MATSNLPERLKRLEIPGRVTFIEGSGELPKIEIIGAKGQAEIYLHGAHVTHFQKAGEDPLLFLSRFSRFAQDQAIRGGIPVIFPWFGPREGEPTHGFARTEQWELKETFISADDTISLRFALPECVEGANFPPFSFEYLVAISDSLQLEMTVKNVSADTEFSFELCLHSYFAVSDIADVTVHGLKGVRYLDKVDNFSEKVEQSDALKITQEVDRVYLHTTSAVEIRDPGKARKIRIEKTGAASTVLWNPWISKAQQMPDFGNEEYQRMVCVESGNVAANKVILARGSAATMTVRISSGALV